MPTDLARAIVAFINLVREAETRQQERAERGRGPSRARTRSVGAQFARREPAQASDHPSFDLRMATDQDRIAFAQELGAVVEGFGLTVAGEAGQLRSATTELVALLTG